MAAVIALLLLALVASAHAAPLERPSVHVRVLSTFPAVAGPASAAATNLFDVVVPAAGKLVRVWPNGQQLASAVTLPGGAFGIGPIGIAYDRFHTLYVALPQALAPPASGAPGILQAWERHEPKE